MLRRRFSCRALLLERSLIHFNHVEDSSTNFQSLEWNKKLLFFAKKKHAKEAHATFLDMKKKNIPYTLESFALLLRAHAANHHLEHAIQVMREMEQWSENRLIPCRVYLPLIEAYCQVQQFDKALSLLSHMRFNATKLDATCYLPLIQHMCKHVKTGRAMQLAKLVLKQQMPYKELIIQSLLDHFLKQGYGEYAMYLLRVLRSSKIVPHKRHFVMVLRTLVKQGKLMEQLLVIKVCNCNLVIFVANARIRNSTTF